MILPIIPYGNPVLKKMGEEITPEYPELKEFINSMLETLKSSRGLGLAAHQVGIPIKLFLVDLSAYGEVNVALKNFKKVFINTEILEESGEEWYFEEGCLSIPGIHEDIKRKPKIKIRYFDESFVCHEEEFDGLQARVIQHEYDHSQGILMTDKMAPLRKRMLQKKIKLILKGDVNTSYKMKFK